MKYPKGSPVQVIFSFFLILFFIGCSGGDAKTTGTVVSNDNYDKRAVIYTNETREIELELDLKNSYKIVSTTERASDAKVEHKIVYVTNSTRPFLEIKGISAGEEKVSVESTSPDGSVKTIRTSVLVVPSTATDVDEIGTEGAIDYNGTVPTDNNDSDGGTTDPGTDPTTPPSPNTDTTVEYDRNACLDNNTNWKTVSDDWTSTEGQVSEDQLASIRSIIITNNDSMVTMYYPAIYNYSTPIRTYDLGRYTYTTKEGVQLIWSAEVAMDMVGKYDYFYVKSNNYCLKMKIPGDSLTPPDKSVTWVGAGF